MAQVLGMTTNVIFLLIGIIIMITVLSTLSTLDVSECAPPQNNTLSKAMAKSCDLTSNLGGVAILIFVLITVFGGMFAFGFRR